MSFKCSFNKNLFALEKLNLPSRYYYFNDCENYIKILSIGEGIFPKDRIKTSIKLLDSTCIFTTESASKVYPSKKEFGINSVKISLENSNCEFINDELILYKDAKLIQLLRINLDTSSTFFYVDILSQGRSYENFDFTKMLTRNKFYINGDLEYFENFEVSGEDVKDYIKRHEATKTIFAKIYIKANNNDDFLELLHKNNLPSFTYSKSKQIILGLIIASDMFKLKDEIKRIWALYRKSLNKKEFDLGKL